jgi:hypothetical protein
MVKIAGNIHPEDGVPEGYLEVLNRVAKDQLEVEIVNTDENGEWLYAVVVCDSSWIGDGDSYWLGGFKRLLNARKFCEKNKLNCRGKVQRPYGTNSSQGMKIVEWGK